MNEPYKNLNNENMIGSNDDGHDATVISVDVERGLGVLGNVNGGILCAGCIMVSGPSKDINLNLFLLFLYVWCRGQCLPWLSHLEPEYLEHIQHVICV